jgi:hypothetical protein
MGSGTEVFVLCMLMEVLAVLQQQSGSVQAPCDEEGMCERNSYERLCRTREAPFCNEYTTMPDFASRDNFVYLHFKHSSMVLC